MAKDLNRVLIIGRVDGEPHMEYTPTGTAKLDLTLAYTRIRPMQDGETREQTERFKVTVWNRLAEAYGNVLPVGGKVYLEGRFQTRSWMDQSGQRKYASEIIANDLTVIDPSPNGALASFNQGIEGVEIRDLNKMMLIGRLGKKPEMSYTPDGSPVVKFSFACSRRSRGQDGELQDETDWFNVVSFNKLAEIMERYLDKGSKAYIEGRLTTRTFEDRSGQQREWTEVVSSDMIMLDSRRSAERSDFGEPVASSGRGIEDVDIDDMPF